MNIDKDIVVTVIVTAALVCLLLSWFYERELGKQRTTIKSLEALHLDRTYDWLRARQEAAGWQAEAFSFSDALLRHVESRGQSEPSMDEHLATLFDEELMMGNRD